MRQDPRIGTFRLSLAGELIAADGEATRITGGGSSAGPPGPSSPPLEEAQARVRGATDEPHPFSFETTWVTPAGEERCARVLLLPARGAGGALLHFDGVVEELEVRTCRAPASSVGFVESLLDGLPNAVFVKDEQHRWVLLNAAYCRLMGRERAELLGKSDFDFFKPEEASVFWAKDDVVFAHGGIDENEEQFTDSSGRTHVIITRKTLHTDAQGQRFLLGVITDITALREATEQLRASRDQLEEGIRRRTAELSAANALLRDQDANRAAFLNVLGHELRNPISAIRTSTTLLERAPPESPAALRARAVIARQGEHLTRLCDDLLDAARLARGKLELHRRVVQLSTVVENVCEDLRASFDAQGVLLAFEGSGEPLWVDADETRLAQAVGNLLHNALKFTPPAGRVDVVVRHGDRAAQVVVRDSGVGAGPEELQRMFEPFVQLAAARGGLGMGLPLARGLVEAHGGTLHARSEGRERGVEMTVTLPPAAAPPAEAAGEPARRAPGPGLRILLIEDQADFRDSLADFLRMEGHRVELAADGRSGVQLARSARPEVVLCDLGLPDLDGCEVARLLRSDADPAVSSGRLIALSGFARTEDAARALAAGFDAHLTKPLALDRLEAAMGGSPGGAR
jgi:PAS domain S-box-containing protein